MQFTTTHKEEHKKRSRRGSSFLTRPFSFPHFLPHFTSRNVRINALLLQKRVVVCLLSLSHPSLLLLPLRVV